MNVRLGLVLNHFIDEGKDVVALDSQQDERGTWVRVGGGVSPSDTTRVDEVLAIVLRDAMLVSVSTDEDVTVELSLHGSECLHVAPRDHLVTVDDANLKVVDLHHFSLWETWHFITVTLDDVCLAFCGSQVLEPLHHLLLEKCTVSIERREKWESYLPHESQRYRGR